MSEKISEFDTQAAPVPNENEPVWKLVIQDMEKRDNTGFKKYGTRLQAFNGRNSSLDVYEELLDAVVYMKQQQEERKIIVEFLKKVSIPQSSDSLRLVDERYDLGFEAHELLKKLGEIK